MMHVLHLYSCNEMNVAGDQWGNVKEAVGQVI